MITTDPKLTEFRLDVYEAGTGKKIDTPIETTTDPLEVLKASKQNRSEKRTTLTTLVNYDATPKHRDADDDIQNDLMWSSYEVMK